MNRAQRVAVLIGLLLGLAGLSVGFSGYSVFRNVVPCKGPLAGGGVDAPRPTPGQDGWQGDLTDWKERDRLCRSDVGSRQGLALTLLAFGALVSLGGSIALREDGPR